MKGFKVLDNSAAEGFDYHYRDILPAARMIGAQEIVLPDVLYSAEATVANARMLARDIDREFCHLAVAQGRTAHDVIWSIEQYYDMPYVSTVALPRLLNEIQMKQRYYLLEALSNRDDLVERFQWHILGASRWVQEIAYLSDFSFVRGMDTSLPVVLGMHAVPIQTGKYVSRPDGFFDMEVTGERREFVLGNCRQYLAWAGAETPSGDVREVQPQ